MTRSNATPRWTLILAITPLLVLVAVPSSAIDVRGNFDKNGQYAELLVPANEQAAQKNRAIPPEQRLVEYERAPFCREAAGLWVHGFADGTCAEGADRALSSVQCQEGDTFVMPMWLRQRATPTSPWSQWTNIDPGGCDVDLLPVLTAEDFRRLPLPAPTLIMQPDRGWVLVNIETITHTNPAPVTLRTDLLGYGITVQATPVRWTYDYGDGHTLSTTSPGRPYPEHDVFHEYEHPGTATISLTAEWTGRYQIDGHPTWRDINGTATTTATTGPFTIEERTSRLVSGLCTDTPKPPDC